jgi:hypothetical protein
MGAGGESLDAAKPAVQELPASLTWMQISAACMDGRKLMVINGEVRNMMAERGRGVLAVPTRASVASYDLQPCCCAGLRRGRMGPKTPRGQGPADVRGGGCYGFGAGLSPRRGADEEISQFAANRFPRARDAARGLPPMCHPIFFHKMREKFPMLGAQLESSWAQRRKLLVFRSRPAQEFVSNAACKT